MLTPADLDAELDRLVKARTILVAGLLLELHRGRIELLEDPRDRGEVGGGGLDQLLDDLLGVASVVDDRRPELEGGQLRGEGKGVGEREEEVRALARRDEVELDDHLTYRHRVAVREDHALGRP